MSKIFSKISAGLLVAAAMVWPAGAAAPVMKTLTGHVPQAATMLAATGALPATNQLNLVIGLPLRNREGLTNLMQQIYDPSSPNYHHFLTPEQFTAQFGPTEQDYQAVKDFAAANGLTVSGTHPNRVLLDVKAPVSTVERTFHVKFNTYQHPTEARSFYAPSTEPTVDATLPILHLSQMDSYYLPHPNLKKHPQTNPLVKTPAAGSAPGGNYQGQDFRNAYVPGTTLTGAGQNVGLLQFDGFYASDAAAYATLIGLANPPKLIVVPVDGGVPTPTQFGNPEVSLDIDMIFSMAPGVSNIYVYEAPNPSPWVDLLGRMANDNVAKQLSCSWGGGSPDATAEQIFQQMALQGQTFFNAVGDSDAFTGFVSFPSDSPHITEVGGTTLTTSNNAVYASETVWNWGVEFGPANDGIGSSGGISPNYLIPSWQTNINITTSHGSATQRNMPDVALTADHCWVIYGNGISDWFGGTSAAAPLWCGYTAMINQQGAINSRPPVGFLNPALYSLAKNPVTYTNSFHDTTTGNNAWSQSPNQFYATNNYDLCTGLGTPNGTNLINALVGNTVTASNLPPPIISAPLGPWPTNLSAMNGSNPNGDWFLFVQDDKQQDVGMINSGWSIALTTANLVGYPADIALCVTPTNSPLPEPPGTNFNLTLSVTNYGPATGTNVYVTDTLPTPENGVTLISSNLSLGTFTRFGGSFIWNLGNLPVNAGGTLTLTFAANLIGQPYENDAIVSISSSTPDPNPDDNTVSTKIAVAVRPAPALSGAALVEPGNHFMFKVAGGYDTYGVGTSVIVQASTNLLTWVPIFTNTTPFNYTNLDATYYADRFYRVIPGQ
ncbi:MAG: protease pro-enzyme activation domain-containing protein [Verrucomicrobiae bacterium]|nr:protease pro-enzyme activation domain-containing protein [Verrucomicrobiae bacterium]